MSEASSNAFTHSSGTRGEEAASSMPMASAPSRSWRRAGTSSRGMAGIERPRFQRLSSGRTLPEAHNWRAERD